MNSELSPVTCIENSPLKVLSESRRSSILLEIPLCLDTGFQIGTFSFDRVLSKFKKIIALRSLEAIMLLEIYNSDE
jgi:hypothetical protein